METKSHWEGVYTTRDASEVSWYQERPALSLQLIGHTGIDPAAQIIDVGGGASRLAGELLAAGYLHVTVLDVSAAALAVARDRLGDRGRDITWLEADITKATLPADYYDLWHDRAVFHFLTDPADRRRYVETLNGAVRGGGHVIIATFGPDGPTRCSGLEVVRYSPEGLRDVLGEGFELEEHASEIHRTPFGTDQHFIYCRFRKR